MRSVLHGHLWTIGPRLRHALSPETPPPSALFTATVEDPDLGSLRLTGRVRHANAPTLLVVIHGLGGHAGSHYTIAAARAAERAGLACLRLNLRGADRRGEDYYHAGQTADLRAALASPELDRYARVVVLGYSLGGHVTLRALAEGIDRRVTAAAAVCSPLDLTLSARAIDRPERALYRWHVLRGLKEMYAEVAARRPVPIPVAEALRIRTLRDWDERVVAPRHGFEGAEHYWRETSVAPLLDRIRIPALVVVTRRDPMVLLDTVEEPLRRASEAVTRVWLDRGGHVGFPAGLDLGTGGGGTLEDQTVAWMLRQPAPLRTGPTDPVEQSQ